MSKTKPKSKSKTKPKNSSHTVTVEEIQALMEQQAQEGYGLTADEVLMKYDLGKLPCTLRMSHIRSMASLLRYAKETAVISEETAAFRDEFFHEDYEIIYRKGIVAEPSDVYVRRGEDLYSVAEDFVKEKCRPFFPNDEIEIHIREKGTKDWKVLTVHVNIGFNAEATEATEGKENK